MNLQFTGIGAAYYPQLGNNCAFFLHNNHLFLIDCGNDTFAKMILRKELYTCSSITVLVTHNHPDHIGSLGTLITFSQNILKHTVRVIAPDNTIVQILSLSGIQSNRYFLTTDFEICEFGGISIIPYKATHSNDIPCYGFLIKDEKEIIYFSGDTSEIPKDILSQFYHGDIQTLYLDCTNLESSGHSHCSLQQLESLIPKNFRSQVFCMHLGGEYQDKIRACGFNIPEYI